MSLLLSLFALMASSASGYVLDTAVVFIGCSGGATTVDSMTKANKVDASYNCVVTLDAAVFDTFPLEGAIFRVSRFIQNGSNFQNYRIVYGIGSNGGGGILQHYNGIETDTANPTFFTFDELRREAHFDIVPSYVDFGGKSYGIFNSYLEYEPPTASPTWGDTLSGTLELELLDSSKTYRIVCYYPIRWTTWHAPDWSPIPPISIISTSKMSSLPKRTFGAQWLFPSSAGRLSATTLDGRPVPLVQEASADGQSVRIPAFTKGVVLFRGRSGMWREVVYK